MFSKPESREGNLLRYLVYLIAFAIVAIADKLALKNSALSLWQMYMFAVLALACLILFVYGFYGEQQYFDRSYDLDISSWYWMGILLGLLVALIHVAISYLQQRKGMPASDLQQLYSKRESNQLFWFVMMANGVVLPVLEQYLCSGFLFNYWFRYEDKGVAYFGLICSAVLYAIICFQFKPMFFVINLILGLIFAWSYLHTQSVFAPISLAVFNGVLTVITLSINNK